MEELTNDPRVPREAAAQRGGDFARSLSGHWLKMLHFNSNTSSLMSFMIAG